MLPHPLRFERVDDVVIPEQRADPLGRLLLLVRAVGVEGLAEFDQA